MRWSAPPAGKPDPAVPKEPLKYDPRSGRGKFIIEKFAPEYSFVTKEPPPAKPAPAFLSFLPGGEPFEYERWGREHLPKRWTAGIVDDKRAAIEKAWNDYQEFGRPEDLEVVKKAYSTYPEAAEEIRQRAGTKIESEIEKKKGEMMTKLKPWAGAAALGIPAVALWAMFGRGRSKEDTRKAGFMKQLRVLQKRQQQDILNQQAFRLPI